MTIDLAKLNELAEKRYLSRRQHPSLDLLIWNYTAKTQYERAWTPETLSCRGLVTDLAGNVVARPMPKFFNWDEIPEPLPSEPFEVTEKVDGSLGVVFCYRGHWLLASRGSFDGEQARRGAAMLQDKYHGVRFDAGLTYCVEIVYPGNRIVVDYGDREELVFLAAIDTETGKDVDGAGPTRMPWAKRYGGVTDFASIKAMGERNSEGFVVRFLPSNLRVKVKLDEYKRLHRLLTGVNPTHVWELLSTGQGLDGLLQAVPDEYYEWVRGVEAGLTARFDAIEAECRRDFKALPTRKETALHFQTCKYQAVLFAMLDGKDHRKAIWKLCRPEGGRAFRCDGEATP